jgi:hypothetical protein
LRRLLGALLLHTRVVKEVCLISRKNNFDKRSGAAGLVAFYQREIPCVPLAL